jgi:hypothetical protein
LAARGACAAAIKSSDWISQQRRNAERKYPCRVAQRASAKWALSKGATWPSKCAGPSNTISFQSWPPSWFAAVDQGDLAEVLARAEGRNLCLSRGDDEECGAARAFHDDCLALRKAPFLEQTGDLLGLPPIHAGEELDVLEGGDGVARRRAGRCPGMRVARRDRAALEEVEHPVLKRPLDVAARAVDLLAL